MSSVMVNNWVTQIWLESGDKKGVMTAINFADSLNEKERLRELEFIKNWCLEHHHAGDALLEGASEVCNRLNRSLLCKDLNKLRLKEKKS